MRNKADWEDHITNCDACQDMMDRDDVDNDDKSIFYNKCFTEAEIAMAEVMKQMEAEQ